MSQPSSVPLAMYSCILSCNAERESVWERNSITKSGHNGGNPLRCSSVRAYQHDSLTHARSGERFAPFGNEKTVDESNPTPVPSALAHEPKDTDKAKLRLPVSPPVGGMTIMSPSLVRSIRQS